MLQVVVLVYFEFFLKNNMYFFFKNIMYRSHLPTNQREKKRKHFDDILVFSSHHCAL